MLKLKVSGSFKTQPGSDKDRCNFSDVEVIIPLNDWEYHIQHGQRMFPKFLEKNEKYADKNYEGLIKLYVDHVEEIDGEPECLHKDIKQMSWEELQSLACYKKLREIPLYKIGDIRKARERAYEVYTEQVEGRRVFRTVQDLQKFRRNMLADDKHTETEVDFLIEKSLNMVVDPERPDKSYNFANLPSLYVDGKLEEEKTSDTSESESDENVL